MKFRKFSLLNRIYHGGLRRAKEFYIETATRLGIFNRRPSFESSLRPGVTLATIGDWGKGQKFFIERDTKEQVVAFLKKISSEAPDLLVAEADRNCAHIFDLLGSGPSPLGEKIDWHVDFKTGYRWNPKTYYKRIQPAPYPGGYDIKVPWELSRCQHFVRLGQAYWITNDEKYTREFIVQVTDWIESNPWPWGVNWTSTMDVAIRVVNWIWAYHFFKGSPSLSDEFLFTFYNSLLVHGCHIRSNLENKGVVTNNHYLADLVGLIYLGILCPEFKYAVEWRKFGLREIWREILKQVYDDGVTFEASIPYHRLTTELLLSPILLCRLNGIPIPNDVMVCLEKMLEFVMYYTKPDGTIPVIGDADNGRIYRLRVWNPSEREWLDHRYLLAIGAVLFVRDDFTRNSGDQWQEALWLLGNSEQRFKIQMKIQSSLPEDLTSKCFPNGGFYVMRSSDSFLLLNCGLVGQNGNGGHAHNDILSFEMYSKGSTFLVDPGNYVYTENWQARNEFRSTAYHNTITVNGADINPINERLLFQLKQTATPKVNSWISTNEYDLLDCEHDGFCRLDSKVTHRRMIYFAKLEGVWLILDRLIGQSEYRIDLYFHFMPGEIFHSKDNLSLYCTTREGTLLALVFLDTSMLTLEEKTISWLARSYGMRESTPVVHYRGIGNSEIHYLYALFPLSTNDQVDLYRLRERGMTILNKFQSLGLIDDKYG